MAGDEKEMLRNRKREGDSVREILRERKKGESKSYRNRQAGKEWNVLNSGNSEKDSKHKKDKINKKNRKKK